MSLVEKALQKSRDARNAQASAERAAVAEEPSHTMPPEAMPTEDVPVHAPAAPPQVFAPAAPQHTAASSVSHGKRIVLEREAVRAAGYLAPADEQNEINEQFRHIKRPLVARALGRGEAKSARGHVIMIASALSGEGKTFCAFNLALSLAFETDVEVLLVDADFRNPQLSGMLGLDRDRGMGDVLAEPTLDLESLVVDTDIPSLAILPAGRWVDTSAELLASSRMDSVLQRLAAAAPNRLIVMDAPPLLLTNEAKILAEAAGQVVLVVRASSTPQRAVTDAIGFLRKEQFVGLVFNGSDSVQGLGYGYGYYEGSYKYGREQASGA